MNIVKYGRLMHSSDIFFTQAIVFSRKQLKCSSNYYITILDLVRL